MRIWNSIITEAAVISSCTFGKFVTGICDGTCNPCIEFFCDVICIAQSEGAVTKFIKRINIVIPG